MATYTYISQIGNFIYSRGFYSNGERFNKKEAFAPTLFISSNRNNAKDEWKDLYGNKLYPINPGNIRDCRDFIERYKDVEGFTVSGMTNWVVQYTAKEYPNKVEPNQSYTRILIFDIETAVEHGRFPSPETADEEVILISTYDTVAKRLMLYTTKDHDSDVVNSILAKNGVDPSSVYISKSIDEKNLLRTFVTDWATNTPDAISGWNIETFDIPYLVNRIDKVLGESFVEKLSPWGKVIERHVSNNGKDVLMFTIVGVATLDYLSLMKKFTYGERESWKLGDVAQEELGQSKLELPGTFKEAYTNHWNEFVAYSLIDSFLVKRMEDKLGLINLAYVVAYMAKVNPDDIFSPIRTWDSFIYNLLNAKKIVVPNHTKKHSNKAIAGGFVKEPQVGKHKWIITLDLASLYPHIMMHTNISPETIDSFFGDVTTQGLLDKKYDTSSLKEKGLALAGNGWTFRHNTRGFVPEMVDNLYKQRSAAKKEMLAAQQEYESTKQEHLVSKIATLDAYQMAVKILMNSLYGATASPHFRFFDNRIAEAITLTGQLGIQWVAKDLNKFLNKACNTSGVDYVIYCDTDSVMITLESIVEKMKPNASTYDKIQFMKKFGNEVLQKVVNKSYEEMKDYLNSYEQKFVMKVEKICDAGIWVAKKRYALNVHNSEGVQYNEPKIKATGLEIVRSSTPAVVRESLKEGLKQVLYGTEKSVREFVQEYRNEYMKLPVEAISFPSGVNGLETYAGSPIYSKGCPIHVRAALLYNHYIKKMGLEDKYELIGEGGKMKYVYLKLPNHFKENVIGYATKLPPEFKLDGYIDYDTMFSKSFESGMKSLVGPLGWSLESGASLEDLFA